MVYGFSWRAYTSTIDQTGNIYFPRVFERVDDGIQEFLDGLGFELHRLIPEEGLALPIVHAEADYHTPIQQGDRVNCEVVVEPGASSVRFLVTGLVEDEAVVDVEIVRVFVDLATGEPQELPVWFRDRLIAHTP